MIKVQVAKDYNIRIWEGLSPTIINNISIFFPRDKQLVATMTLPSTVIANGENIYKVTEIHHVRK